jgi:hypothetical protein
MPEKKGAEFAPARYIGNHVIDLGQTGRREWFNIDGSRRTNMMLQFGDTVMMPAHEVLGQTFLNLKNGPHLYLGAGKKVRKEDGEKSEEELKAMGYQWDMPRRDFEALGDVAEDTSESHIIVSSLEIDPSQIIEEAK